MQVQKVTYGRKKTEKCIEMKSECNRGDIVAFFGVLFVILFGRVFVKLRVLDQTNNVINLE